MKTEVRLRNNPVHGAVLLVTAHTTFVEYCGVLAYNMDMMAPSNQKGFQNKARTIPAIKSLSEDIGTPGLEKDFFFWCREEIYP